MNTVATTKQPEDRIEIALTKMEDKFSQALPAHIPAKRFVRAALSAVSNPLLKKSVSTPAGQRSIYEACLKAASDGLLLDGREAALVEFNTKTKDGEWVSKVQYMPMVAGILKKARNSGEISTIICQVVYENDQFEIDYVTEDAPIKHKPILGDRGKAIGVYALARFKDGYWSAPEVMSVAEVNAIRARSKTYAKDGKGPWATDWGEMARKTVLKRLAKYLPSSTDRDDFQSALQRIEEPDELVTIDGGAVNEPVRLVKKGAAALIDTTQDDDEPSDDAETHDAETGEVLDADDNRGSAAKVVASINDDDL